MNLFALQEATDEYYPVDEFPWANLIATVLLLLIALPLLVCVFRSVKRAMSQNNEVLVLNRECLEVSREAVDVTKQSIELQRENNRLLAELNATLKNPPAT